MQDYLTQSSSTPATLVELYKEFDVPTAPEERPAYKYEPTEKGFRLCATFSRDSVNPDENFSVGRDMTTPMPIKNPDNWNFKAGEYCFDRVIK